MKLNSGITLLALLLPLPAAAEVRVELNSVGHVVDVVVETDLETGTVWGRLSSAPEAQLLNPLGDESADRFPTSGIVALPTEDAMKDRPSLRFAGRGGSATGGDSTRRRTPVVAWPRFDGLDWEIVYSVWDYKNGWWTAPAFVELGNNEIDDLDPQLHVRGKRVVLVWRRGGGTDDRYALATGKLIVDADGYELVWNPPVELTAPAGSDPGELTRLLGTGIGNADLEPVDR